MELYTLSLESSLVCLASVVLLAQIFEHMLTSLCVHAAITVGRLVNETNCTVTKPQIHHAHALLVGCKLQFTVTLT